MNRTPRERASLPADPGMQEHADPREPVLDGAGARAPRSTDEARVLDAADRAMARYANGDAESFREVFGLVAPRLLGFGRRLAGSDEAARELLQEALLRMHQARAAFRPGSRVLPWAYAIARNVFLDSARSRRRARALFSARDPEEVDEPMVRPEAESAVIAGEAQRAVERALAAMTPARREAFILLRYEGLSVAEAAEILGASEGAVKLRAFQAYELIREALARLEGGAGPVPPRARARGGP
jgi:RNA polymerase sigma-70 factor (ECF subfamily)